MQLHSLRRSPGFKRVIRSCDGRCFAGAFRAGSATGTIVPSSSSACEELARRPVVRNGTLERLPRRSSVSRGCCSASLDDLFGDEVLPLPSIFRLQLCAFRQLQRFQLLILQTVEVSDRCPAVKQVTGPSGFSDQHPAAAPLVQQCGTLRRHSKSKRFVCQTDVSTSVRSRGGWRLADFEVCPCGVGPQTISERLSCTRNVDDDSGTRSRRAARRRLSRLVAVVNLWNADIHPNVRWLAASGAAFTAGAARSCFERGLSRPLDGSWSGVRDPRTRIPYKRFRGTSDDVVVEEVLGLASRVSNPERRNSFLGMP